MSAHTRLSRAQARLRRAARAYAAADSNQARERTFGDLSHAAITYAAAKADVERERAAKLGHTGEPDCWCMICRKRKFADRLGRPHGPPAVGG